MDLQAIAQAIGAHLKGPNHIFKGVCIDSRQSCHEQLFVAIEGQRFDGHDYISQAIKQGAHALLIHNEYKLADIPSTVSILKVEDTTKGLGRLAAYWRQQYEIPVFALTGSCGKTTTKELTYTILNQSHQTLATQGTLNNHWGLPLTLLSLNKHHEVAILELGANHPHEIDYLAKIARPTAALITNVAPVHIAGFGSEAQIAKEKGQIYAYLKHGDWALINRDDQYYSYWLNRLPKGVNVLTFGCHDKADLRATDLQLQDGQLQFILTYQTQSCPIRLNLKGAYQVNNALAAAALSIVAGENLASIQSGLAQCKGPAGRMQLHVGKKGVKIIDDSYNANPTAVKAAINYLASCKGETVMILGEMGELGEAAPLYHTEIGAYAKKQGIHQLLAVGPLCQYTTQEFGSHGQWFNDKIALIKHLNTIVHDTMTILVKGSRSSQMETIITAINSE